MTFRSVKQGKILITELFLLLPLVEDLEPGKILSTGRLGETMKRFRDDQGSDPPGSKRGHLAKVGRHVSAETTLNSACQSPREPSLLTADQVMSLETSGYCKVGGLLGEGEVSVLRDECDALSRGVVRNH